MNTVLNEIFLEGHPVMPANGCNCRHKRIAYGAVSPSSGIDNEIYTLGRELSSEEEYEWRAAFDTIKNLGQKIYQKAKKPIAVARIIGRLLSPLPPPHTVTKDVAVYIEEDKKQKRQALVESANRRKPAFIQKPDPEVSLLQEIFSAAEREMNEDRGWV